MKDKITKKFIGLCIALILLASPSQLKSQTPSYYNSSSGTSSNTFPLSSSTNRVQWIYDANTFKTGGTSGSAATSGNITKIYFRLGSRASSSASYSDFTISLAQNVGTTSTWNSTSWATGLTQCFYQSTFQLSGAQTNSWVSITLQTPFTYDPSKSLVFEMKLSAGTGNYVAQVTSGGSKRRWGTYSGGSGSSYGSGLVDFGFDLARGSNDAGILAVSTPLCAPIISATYANHGINSIDSVKINWMVNNVLQQQVPYNTSLASGKAPVEVTLTPNYNFIDGKDYDVRVWTSMPNGKSDTLNLNDSAQIKFQYMGPAGTPTTKDGIKCGPGKAPLIATTPFATDSVVWYNESSGGEIVAKGKNTLSPALLLGTNTFYAQAFKISGAKFLENNLFGNYTYYTTGRSHQGGYANLTPKNDLFLDSFRIRLYYNTSGSTYSIFMREGSYINYQSDPNGWIQLADDDASNVRTINGMYIATLKIPETMLLKGKTYGFYILSTGTNPVWTFGYNSTGNTSSNSELDLFTQHYFYGTAPFSGTVAQGYPINLEANYRTANCPSNRIPAEIVVKPSPKGASFKKGSPFQTTQLFTNGTLGSPDIIAKSDQLTYELIPPTGYSNSGYSSTWTSIMPTVTTANGTPIPSGSLWNYAAPSGGNAGILTITPDSTLEDSFLIVNMLIKDLGPWYCDSTILKHVFVAPRPVPDFAFAQPICDGDAVVFSNKSKIASGKLSHKWEFNTGNPADTGTTSDFVFTFPTFGNYDVTLTTTSKPYGYKASVTYSIFVTEIPVVNFKVLNACEKVPVTFKNNTTIGSGVVSYEWDFGDPTTNADKSTLKEPSWIYSKPNGYKVTLKASANGCYTELSKNANQFATPTAGFKAPQLICDKSDVTFTNTSTILTGNMGYHWNFGDGGVSNFANPIHQFTNSTPKTIKLKSVSEFGCVDSIVKTISLTTAPHADFEWSEACNLTNTEFKFTGSKPAGALTNFLWDFSGEGSSTLENPSKKFDVVSRKQVKLTLLSNNGCGDEIVKEVNVKLQSKALFQAADVCEGEEAVFINSSIVTAGNLVYQWKFGDGTTSFAQSPRHQYMINGLSQTYNVTLVAIVPGGCSDSISNPVTVNANPNSDFSYTTNGRLVSFTAAQTGNTSYYWRFGDGGNNNLPNTQYHFLNFPSGEYKTCLAVLNAAGCFSETCKTVNISGSAKEIKNRSNLVIYPNPSNGHFEIILAEAQTDLEIDIYNSLGAKIMSLPTNVHQLNYSVELDSGKGIYFLRVLNGGITYTYLLNISR